MHRCARFASTTALLTISLATSPLHAAKDAPVPHEPVSGPAVPRSLGSPGLTPLSGYGPCPAGVFPPASLVFGHVLPPGDTYYTLLSPAGCDVASCWCMAISVAHVQLSFDTDCAIPVTISIVRGSEAAPGCPVPNPEDVICNPTTYILDNAGVRGTCIDFAMPISGFCCGPPDPTFLALRFDQGSCPEHQPAFCSPAQCTNCTQYNLYPGSPPGGDDLCAVLSPSGVFGAIMYVDAYCYPPDAVTPGSWGKLKTIYR